MGFYSIKKQEMMGGREKEGEEETGPERERESGERERGWRDRQILGE